MTPVLVTTMDNVRKLNYIEQNSSTPAYCTSKKDEAAWWDTVRELELLLFVKDL